jgi:hypothetical protein
VVDPFRKVTVPVGLPPEVTVAVKVKLFPSVMDVELAVSAVLVVAWTAAPDSNAPMEGGVGLR